MQMMEYAVWDGDGGHAARSFGSGEMVAIFRDMLGLAKRYNALTGSHLQLYGDLGELFGVLMFGIKLHANYAEGSDGRLGDDFVEVKTIAPFNRHDAVTVRMDRHFSKLLVVNIGDAFKVEGWLIDRDILPDPDWNELRVYWDDISLLGR